MSAPEASLVRVPRLQILINFVLVVSSSHPIFSSGVPESETLLKFKDSFADSTAISNWSSSTSPCAGDGGNWIGVLCFNGSVWGLQLENMGLKGSIDLDSLLHLPYLRTISFMNNNLDGPMPPIGKLGALKSVFLSGNHFSGEITVSAFEGMHYLKKVFLSNNDFRGEIPSSLGSLPRLLELRLNNNKFEGRIPLFRQKYLKIVDLSNNALEGPIPAILSEMPSSFFSENKNLCGKPLDPCHSPKKSSHTLIIIIITISVLVLLAIILLITIFHCKNKAKPQQHQPAPPLPEQAISAAEQKQQSGQIRKAEQSKLSFVREDRERFELEDLLRAPAEVWGSGSFGSSYKATLSGGQVVVVVKRYRQMNNLGRGEFHEHMRRIGRLSHPNLVPLVAYYYRREEKLLVTDFVPNGSLASRLHGKRTSREAALDWPTRLKIIKGVAKGLSYLSGEISSLNAPHGHLKSSNVVLNESMEPLLTDYALIPVINPHHAQDLMVAYKSPEFARHGRTTKKTDVWSLGVLILETLTAGKFPTKYLTTDLADWVRPFADSEGELGLEELFDEEMGGVGDEMVKLLKIGLGCCEEDVERRLDLREAVQRIEEVKGGEGDDHENCSSFNAGDAGKEDDIISLPAN